MSGSHTHDGQHCLCWVNGVLCCWCGAGDSAYSLTHGCKGNPERRDCDDLCSCGHERFAHMVDDEHPGPCASRSCGCQAFVTEEKEHA
jgi:hypothetical protein